MTVAASKMAAEKLIRLGCDTSSWAKGENGKSAGTYQFPLYRAISGHASLSEVQRYTKAADQARMASAAMALTVRAKQSY